MNSRLPDLDLTDERLREWAYFFRDRKQLERCRSIESRYRRHSEDGDPDGWGDEDSTPQTSPARSYQLLRALETHEAIQSLDRIYKWAITFGFAYPYLPKFVVIRAMRKYTGRRLTWKAYLEALDIGRMMVHTTICLTRNEFAFKVS